MLEWAARIEGTAESAFLINKAGVFAWREGDLDAADRYFTRAARLFSTVGDTSGQAQSLYNRHYLAWVRSQHRAAMDLAQASYEAALSAGDRGKQVNALVGLAAVFEDVGFYRPARAALRKARASLAEDDAAGLVNVLNLLGLLHAERGRHGLALIEFEQARSALGPALDTALHRRVYLNLTHAQLALKRIDAARESLAAAWRHSDERGANQYALHFYSSRVAFEEGDMIAARTALDAALGASDLPEVWRWELHYWLGRVARERGDRAAAVAAFKQALAAQETLREQLGLDDLKAHLLARKRQPYEALFLLHVQSGDAFAALAVTERAKATVLVDAMLSATAADRDDDQTVTPAMAAARVDALLDIVPRMRASMPAPPTDPTQLISAIGDEVVLSYFFAEEQLYVLTVGQGSVTVRQVATDSTTDLLDAIAKFSTDHRDASNRPTLGEALLPAYPAAAWPSLLHISPDRELNRVSFAALQIDNGFLIEKTAVNYVPSVTAMTALNGRAPATQTPLVVGDPLGDLPAAEAEAHAVGRALRVAPLVGATATGAALRDGADARVLHLATHSGHTAIGPWLALADTRLDAAQIFEIGARAELVVLASCASAHSAAPGYFGSLGGTFLAAGARNVLATLWSVDDRGARRFVQRFFGGSIESIALASAQAQREAIARGEAVEDWASFVPIGLGRMQSQK